MQRFSERRVSERRLSRPPSRMMSKKRLTQEGLLAEHHESVVDHSALQDVVNGNMFQTFMAFVILGNATLIGLETDMPENSDLWEVMEIVFLFVFGLELTIRIMAYHMDFFSGQQWATNIFDFILVVLAVFDFFVTELFHNNLGQLSLVIQSSRLLRVLRLFRLFTMFKHLYILASGIAASASAVFWVTIMSLIILYVCAIFLARTLGSSDATRSDRFNTVGSAMFALFEFMSAPSLHSYESIMESSIWMTIFFIGFTIFGSYALLAVLTGVISEAMLQRSQALQEITHFEYERHKRALGEKVGVFFEQADTDHDNTLSREEFNARVPDLVKLLDESGNYFCAADVQLIFDLCDFDSSGSVDLAEFLEGVSSFTANSRDLPMKCLSLQSRLHVHLADVDAALSARFKELDSLFEKVNSKLDALTSSSA